ncbi:MAG: fibronectin type III domain-containing protein [Sphingobacteriales bacterium]|nr:MAG: fibronectin type III domain-containing protein [Sphingobacteriales bacterium]
MERFKTRKDYKDYSDDKVYLLANNVINNLSSNPDFPAPDPSVAELILLRDEFKIAIINAAFGGKLLIAVRKEKRTVLIEALKRVAIYVDLNGQNIKSVMLGSGFEVYSTAHVVAPPSEKTIILIVKDGKHSGETIVRSKKIKHAIMYQLRYTEDNFGPDAKWTELSPQTKTTYLVSGLTPGTKYWFQTRTISSKGQSEWSDPFLFMVR